MSRLWRSDDTTPWPFGFGNYSEGDVTFSSSADQTLISAVCTATINTNTVSATNAGFASGQLIRIIEMEGANAGKNEFNAIQSYSSGTITTVLKTQNTYVNAQVIVLHQYRDVVINAGVTLSAPQYDQSNLGGFLGFFFRNLTVNGTISGTGRGYTGGLAGRSFGTNTRGFQGNNPSGSQAGSSSQESGGGGSGFIRATNEQGHGGGGAGYAVAGQDGAVSGAGGAEVGQGGQIFGDDGLVDVFLGPGGGGGGCGDAQGSASNGDGGNGGGILGLYGNFLTINPSTGSIVNTGLVGEDGDQDQGAGGCGVGGSIQIKCQTADIGTDRLTSAPVGPAGGVGGGGGRSYGGRINIDYLVGVTGTVSASQYGSFNQRFDSALRNKRAMVSSFML